MSEKMEFKAELKQVMNIIVHSLYSHKEIFLRELISNAADAMAKIRFDSLTNTTLSENDSDYKIKIIPDAANNILTIIDNGCGMTRATLINDLGTIARSGTKAFLEKMQQAKSEQNVDLIGQFGVGFYSSFMVADKVEVHTRAPHEKIAVKWTSNGEDSFTLDDGDLATRGTKIILHLRESEKEFADAWRLRTLIKKFSDFIEYPVILVTDEKKRDKDGKETDEIEHKEEIINSQQAIWLRNKNEIKDEDYAEFYKHLSHDFQPPLKTIHYSAEGAQEFKALLFIPAQRPYDFMMREHRKGLQLYVSRVFITEECEKLLPAYLEFIRGVVDSSDLPLNVSREMLQEDRQLIKIRKALITRIYSTLKEMQEKEIANYEKFWQEFGVFLKSGLAHEFEHREKLQDLLLFASTRANNENKYLTLNQYVEAMPATQTEIYYMIAENREMVENSPYMEFFRERGFEVLIMTDPVDEMVVQTLNEFKGKKLKAIDRGELTNDIPATEKEQREKDNKDLLGFLQTTLKDDVDEVRLSTRLQTSPCCLIGEEGQFGAQMERLMKEMGQALPKRKMILEINSENSAMKKLRDLINDNQTRATDYAKLLYDGAVVAAGGKVKDAGALLRRIAEIIG